jgi:hypothetical protein
MMWSCCARGDRKRDRAGVAASTVGTFLRSFTFGHVRQLDRLTETILGHIPDAAKSSFTRLR